MAKKDHAMDLCSGSILKNMLIFALPLMLSGILQLLFNAADVVVVGRFAGKESLAAVGATSSIVQLMTNLFIGLSIGTNVLVARYFGASQEREVKETIHTSLVIGALTGLFLTAVGTVLARPILVWMQTPSDVLDLSVVYLRTYFLGMTATMVYNFGAATMNAVGDTRRPLYILTAAGAVNVGLNLVFVIKLHWGVFGVAIATVISQVISAVCVVVLLVLEKGMRHVSFRELRISKDKLQKIIAIGLPAGLQSSMFSIANVVIQSSVNSFGSVIMAGNTASQNLESFSFVSMSAFHQAALAFMGQHLGAGKLHRTRRILITAIGCVTVVAATIGVILHVFGEPLIGLYTTDPAVIEAGIRRLHIMALSFVLAGIMDVTVGSIRGLGSSVPPMIVSLLGVCVLRLVWIFTLFRLPAFHTIEMLYITYPISWTITLIAQLIVFACVRNRLTKASAS